LLYFIVKRHYLFYKLDLGKQIKLKYINNLV